MKKNSQFKEYYEKPRDLARIPGWVKFIDKVGIKNYTRIDTVGKLIPECNRLLDIACGDGELIERFAVAKVKESVGIDISKYLIDLAKKRVGKKNAKFVTVDFLEYESKERFDVITATAYLEHVVFPLLILKKMNKMMVKGGLLIIELPNVGYLLHRISLLLGKFPETAPTEGNIPGVDEEHLRFFTAESLAKALELTGFKVESITTSGRLSQIRNFYPSLLGADLVVCARKR